MKVSLHRQTWQAVVMAVFAVLLACSQNAQAQAIYGQILGTVTDVTGAVIPNAAVNVTDEAKGTVVSVTSNGAGEFTVAHLIPDIYDIKVTATGFEAFEQKGVQVFADSSPTVVAKLAVGAADQTVEVSADAEPQLKTDRADVAQIYNAEQLEDFPVPDHNFANLQLLLPGAVQLGWAHAASENPQGSKQIQVDGQAFGGVNYTLDGTDNEDAILGIIVINPNSESMSEAKIATQNFDAEFGKAVASVDTVQTKSGTNSFHGTLFDNREGNANLAKDPFTLGPGQSYPAGLKNQYGGSVGGPVWKNHAFFFADYQGVRQKIGSTGTGTVPTLQTLNSCTGTSFVASNTTHGCDFSPYTRQIYNNSTGTPVAYTGNIIPLNQLAQPALNLFKLLLANKYTPNAVGTFGGLVNNYVGSGTGIFNSNQWDVRGDETINDKMHVFGRFSRFTDILSGASLFGPAGGPGLGVAGYGGVSNGANDSLALGADIAVNPKLVTDVRLGYFRYGIRTKKNDPGNTNLPFIGENVSGGTAALTVPIDYGTPDIQIADFSETDLNQGVSTTQNSGPQFGTGLNMNHCNCPLKEEEDQFQLVNNWTKNIGNHAVKFGVDLRYARNLRVPSDSDRTGVNNFGNGPTSNGTSGGVGFASFILGDVTQFNRYTSTSATETNAKEFQPRDFFYVQDTWRASNKWTINAGMRYEFYAPERVNGAGNGSLLNLATGFINVAGVGGIPLNMGVAAAKNTWNPRLGVAYQYNQKTVIRMGYGRSFDLGVFGSDFGHVVTQNLPVLVNQSLNGVGGNTYYAFNLADPSNTTVPSAGGGKPSNASTALQAFASPAISTAGQIAVNATIPGTNPVTTVGQFASVKARPFTERLPTLDAWNAAVERVLTPSLKVEVSYVGNKGTHTLSDGDGNNTNPNEAAISLPASFNVVNGQALHYDPNGGTCLSGTAGCTGAAIIGASGATKNQTLLQRYTDGNLPACGAGVACNWTQGISYYGDDQDTHYNALQVKLTEAPMHGLSGTVYYAYQVGSDNASGFATWSKAAVKGNDQAIRRNALTAFGIYKLPFGDRGSFIERAVIGGWELSPTFVVQSGLPFSLSYSECATSIPGSAPCQPNGNVGSLKIAKTGHPGAGVSYFTNYYSAANPNGICTANTSPFTCPGLDTIGNVQRNTAWGPGFFNSDMSLIKHVTFMEKYTAEFRFDAYNAFNHINLGNPNGNIDNSGGGSIGGGPYPAGTGGTTNPRQLQFTLHFAF
jgi:hypothetical protein